MYDVYVIPSATIKDAIMASGTITLRHLQKMLSDHSKGVYCIVAQKFCN